MDQGIYHRSPARGLMPYHYTHLGVFMSDGADRQDLPFEETPRRLWTR